MNGQSGPQLRKRYTDLVVFKETVVAIKDLGPQFALNRLMKQEKEELRRMMSMNHRNVAVFHGLLYEDEHGYFLQELVKSFFVELCVLSRSCFAKQENGTLLLLTRAQEYGAHGSLKDILSSKIQLTWEMKKSLVIDLIEGLAYIHRSALGYHGFLNTTSCLVTGRLAVKVGNYAPEILNNPSESDVCEYTRKLQYALYDFAILNGSLLFSQNMIFFLATLQRADVYSFAIIAHEVIYGKGCFWLGPETPNPNIETLGKSSSMNQFKSSVEMANTIVACWAQNPLDRPELERLRKTMTSGPRKDMVDDLATRLQDYTTKLDQMVDQKTRKIAEEKMKSEDLVYNLLPKSVAEDLSTGKAYEPVEFKAVTIYQSDIQGFTKIGTQSAPIQIMTMLRLIYEIFDRIISTVDAYKVETIGDAYVAVSGAHPPNSNHASQIATFALAVHLNQREIDKFKIPHLPDEKLKIRIGLHSGPVVSGVVGNVMPRWC
ncbi:unnamed protein product, partial [Oikopleura dioica]